MKWASVYVKILIMISELLTRAVSNIYPAAEKLKTALESGQKLRIYFGIDPTGPTLHVGHLSVLLKLRDLQDLGKQIKIIILFGDFTAQIGDPTDKSAVQKMMTPEIITENLKNYREQIGKILEIEKTEFRNNSEWLTKLTFAEILDLASNLTISQLIKRDMFQKRLGEEKDLFLHEFLYPVMQGYDSVALDVDLEIGGNDQTFNMLVGRDLLKKLKNKEKFVLATKLLVDPTGEKMGKTTGNMVAFSDTPADAYGKVMSWPDTLLPLAFELCTRLSDEEVGNILSGHPKEAKMRLAREIVALIHDSKSAEEAEQNFVQTFQEGGEPVWEELASEAGEKLVDLLVRAGVVKSKSDFRRLIQEGAVTRWPEEKVKDPDLPAKPGDRLKIGKKRFIQVS